MARIETKLEELVTGTWPGLWAVQQTEPGSDEWRNVAAFDSSSEASDECVVLAARSCDERGVSYAESLRSFRLVAVTVPEVGS